MRESGASGFVRLRGGRNVKLATELQRAQRGGALYMLDEPTTGFHPADVERLPPAKVAASRASRTAPCLRRALSEEAVATAA
jgi:excinuclease ABC subunit A